MTPQDKFKEAVALLKEVEATGTYAVSGQGTNLVLGQIKPSPPRPDSAPVKPAARKSTPPKAPPQKEDSK